jgi:hypothetical protein
MIRVVERRCAASAATPLPGATAFAFEPAIAVDKHGTIGVIWYHRNDRPADDRCLVRSRLRELFARMPLNDLPRGANTAAPRL